MRVYSFFEAINLRAAVFLGAAPDFCQHARFWMEWDHCKFCMRLICSPAWTSSHGPDSWMNIEAAVGISLQKVWKGRRGEKSHSTSQWRNWQTLPWSGDQVHMPGISHVDSMGPDLMRRKTLHFCDFFSLKIYNLSLIMRKTCPSRGMPY